MLVMNGKKIERDTRNREEISDIFKYLKNKLPPGWKVIEGHITVEFEDGETMIHGIRPKNKVPERDIEEARKNHDVCSLLHEVELISKHLDPGWRFSKIILKKGDRIYNIQEKDLPERAKVSKPSWRLDDKKLRLEKESR